MLVGGAWLAMRYLHMAWQPAALLALGLFTPLDGVHPGCASAFGIGRRGAKLVSISAIAGEIAALLVMFVVSQAQSVKMLTISSGILVMLIVLTPLLFLALGKYIVPHAPGSEFSLLVMVAIICGVISKSIGVHVLSGIVCGGVCRRAAAEANDDAGLG